MLRVPTNTASERDPLYARFRSIHLREIESYIGVQSETLQLDFKRAQGPEPSKNDKENLAIAMSGFANSIGGLIVWGVDCRKVDGVDQACGLFPIPKVRAFVSRLRDLSESAVMPRLDRVEHRSISQIDGAGFAVTYVPESDSGPHMAKFGDDHYYKRSGTSFRKMEHFDIADMFGKRRSAHLDLVYHVDRNAMPQIVIGLRNTGRGSARGPYLSLNLRRGPFMWDQFGLNGNGVEGMKRMLSPTRDYSLTYGEGSDFLIHPGRTLDVMRYRLSSQRPIPPDRDVEIDYEYCADEVLLKRGTLLVPLAEVQLS